MGETAGALARFRTGAHSAGAIALYHISISEPTFQHSVTSDQARGAREALTLSVPVCAVPSESLGPYGLH